MSHYGLQTFLVIPTANGMMKNFILDYSLLELYYIIKEHESRLIMPNPVLGDDNCETQESIQAVSLCI